MVVFSSFLVFFFLIVASIYIHRGRQRILKGRRLDHLKYEEKQSEIEDFFSEYETASANQRKKLIEDADNLRNRLVQNIQFSKPIDLQKYIRTIARHSMDGKVIGHLNLFEHGMNSADLVDIWLELEAVGLELDDEDFDFVSRIAVDGQTLILKEAGFING